MRKWMVVVGIVGTLALLAGLHHVVVITARGTAFAAAFSGTCSWCHGDTYGAAQARRVAGLAPPAHPGGWPGPRD